MKGFQFLRAVFFLVGAIIGLACLDATVVSAEALGCPSEPIEKSFDITGNGESYFVSSVVSEGLDSYEKALEKVRLLGDKICDASPTGHSSEIFDWANYACNQAKYEAGKDGLLKCSKKLTQYNSNEPACASTNRLGKKCSLVKSKPRCNKPSLSDATCSFGLASAIGTGYLFDKQGWLKSDRYFKKAGIASFIRVEKGKDVHEYAYILEDSSWIPAKYVLCSFKSSVKVNMAQGFACLPDSGSRGDTGLESSNILEQIFTE